jgi:hypothetical protein
VAENGATVAGLLLDTVGHRPNDALAALRAAERTVRGHAHEMDVFRRLGRALTLLELFIPVSRPTASNPLPPMTRRLLEAAGADLETIEPDLLRIDPDWHLMALTLRLECRYIIGADNTEDAGHNAALLRLADRAVEAFKQIAHPSHEAEARCKFARMVLDGNVPPLTTRDELSRYMLAIPTF